MNSPRSFSTTLRPACFERGVQMNFLGGHRLGLDDGLRLFVADDLQNDFARLLAGAGPMNFRSARFDFCDKLLEIFVEMIDGFPFGFGGKLPCAFPVLKRRPAFVAGDLVIAQRRADDLAMTQIPRHHARLLQKLGRQTCSSVVEHLGEVDGFDRFALA